jgi:hypothetical protein
MADLLKELCVRLVRADPDVRDIIQFGSSVYAPEQARDVDLLITTFCMKDLDVYWSALGDELSNVDLVIREPGDRMGDWIAWGVCATGRVLYGDGETMKEARRDMPVPTFDQARLRLDAGDQYLEVARRATDEGLRDVHYRTAFNALFDAVRSAAMTYTFAALSTSLNTEQTRWGELRRGLPQRHAEAFRRFIDTLHVRYFYDGEYPRENVEGEYWRWRDEVNHFIEALITESQERRS